jgi:nitrate reductase NapE component
MAWVVLGPLPTFVSLVNYLRQRKGVEAERIKNAEMATVCLLALVLFAILLAALSAYGTDVQAVVAVMAGHIITLAGVLIIRWRN